LLLLFRFFFFGEQLPYSPPLSGIRFRIFFSEFFLALDGGLTLLAQLVAHIDVVELKFIPEIEFLPSPRVPFSFLNFQLFLMIEFPL